MNEDEVDGKVVPAPAQMSVVQALAVCEARLAQGRHYQEANLLKSAAEYVAKLEQQLKERNEADKKADAETTDAAE